MHHYQTIGRPHINRRPNDGTALDGEALRSITAVQSTGTRLRLLRPVGRRRKRRHHPHQVSLAGSSASAIATSFGPVRRSHQSALLNPIGPTPPQVLFIRIHQARPAGGADRQGAPGRCRPGPGGAPCRGPARAAGLMLFNEPPPSSRSCTWRCCACSRTASAPPRLDLDDGGCAGGCDQPRSVITESRPEPESLPAGGSRKWTIFRFMIRRFRPWGPGRGLGLVIGREKCWNRLSPDRRAEAGCRTS
jgi:hypothetical protein